MNRATIESWLNGIWYSDRSPPWFLRILEMVYRKVADPMQPPARRASGRPVIVVGNITIGGSGKTPFVIWLVDQLKRNQFRPGVISRGYGGTMGEGPHQISPGEPADMVGDEPLLIFERSGVPVVVGSDRYETVDAHGSDIDVIVSDDGLQHQCMPRTFEIVLVNASRRFGNGHLLPAGPLRQPQARLETVDFVLEGGPSGDFKMVPAPQLHHVLDSTRTLEVSDLADSTVTAVAGIAHPAEFFAQVREAAQAVETVQFADHHAFQEADLAAFRDGRVVMTEKDAVKCREFTQPSDDWWFWPVEVIVKPECAAAMMEKFLPAIAHHQMEKSL